MSGIEVESCETHGRQGRLAIRQAWIDRDGKIISFHPIDSGQLLKAPEQLFWERIISLSNTGYRIQ